MRLRIGKLSVVGLTDRRVVALEVLLLHRSNFKDEVYGYVRGFKR